jgi:hypothetical protein
MVSFSMVREKYRGDRITQPKKGKVLAEHGTGEGRGSFLPPLLL